MSENTIEILTDESFESQVLESEVPYLVEYMSATCAPCAALQPVLEEVAAEMQGAAKIGKVDIFDHPSLPQNQGVMSTPTMIVFVGGEPVKRIFGAKPKRHILTALQHAIEGKDAS